MARAASIRSFGMFVENMVRSSLVIDPRARRLLEDDIGDRVTQRVPEDAGGLTRPHIRRGQGRLEMFGLDARQTGPQLDRPGPDGYKEGSRASPRARVP